LGGNDPEETVSCDLLRRGDNLVLADGGDYDAGAGERGAQRGQERE